MEWRYVPMAVSLRGVLPPITRQQIFLPERQTSWRLLPDWLMRLPFGPTEPSALGETITMDNLTCLPVFRMSWRLPVAAKIAWLCKPMVAWLPGEETDWAKVVFQFG